MSAILVTGASGLIGSHILVELLKQGYAVRALTRDSDKAKAFISNLLAHYTVDSALLEKITWITGDLRDVAQYDELLDSVETVFHCAGLISTSASDRQEMFDVNVACTADLVNHCLSSSVKWFGHISSVASLGPNPDGLVDEDYFWKQDKNQSYYALTKYLGEQEVWRGKEEGLPVLIFNPSVVIGPGGERGNLHKLIKLLRSGMPFYLKGSSGFVDARDLAAFCVLQWKKKELNSRVIVSAENLSQYEFISRLGHALGVPPPSYYVNKFVFNLASFVERIYRLKNSKKRLLHADLFKMGSSVNRYDNLRSVKLGAVYRSIDESIKNSVENRTY